MDKIIRGFLPVKLKEARAKGWDALDVVIISGDAYVDHPSFGCAVIGRILEAAGFRVGIIPQPDINHPADFLALGRPKLCFAIAPGNVDSMLMHFTALKRVRNDDPFSPGGGVSKRPKRAAIAYTSAVRNAAKGVPVIIGGIECSARRLTHYDYWDNKLRRSILLDAKADLLVYGMGERQVVEIVKRLATGQEISGMTDIAGTVYCSKKCPDDAVMLPSFDECRESNAAFQRHYGLLIEQKGNRLCEKAGNRYIVQNPPYPKMTTRQLDSVYELPYMRLEHPVHKKEGGVPALMTVANSVTSHRGCLADCSFCSIAIHQGREMVFRSSESIIREVKRIVKTPGFKGTITDVGGPSANMYGMACKTGGCDNPDCVGSSVCANLDISHKRYVRLLERVSRVKGVKHVYVGSGMRFDLLSGAGDKEFGKIVACYTGGQLKVAPEHSSQRVLKQMNKPRWDKYIKFRGRFYRIAERLGVKRHIVPYIMTSHPGASLEDEKELLNALIETGFVPDQVQDFIPLPMTRSSVMFYTGKDLETGCSIPVARTREEKEKHFAVLRPKDRKYTILRRKLLGGEGKKGR